MSKDSTWSNRVSSTKVSTLTFFCAFGIFLVQRLVAMSLFSPAVDGAVGNLMTLAVVGLIVVGELSEGRVDRLIWVLLVGAAIGFGIAGATGYSGFVVVSFIIYGARYQPFERCALFAIVVTVAVCVGIVASSLAGVVLDFVWVGETRLRHGFGFKYCTYISHLYLNCVLLIVYTRQRLSWPFLGFLALVDWEIYAWTVSRNSFVLTLVALSAQAVSQSGCFEVGSGKLRQLILSLGRHSVIGAFLLSSTVLAVYNIDPSRLSGLNDALSGRLGFTSASLSKYGIRLFGQSINFAAYGLDVSGQLRIWLGEFDTNVIDNAYFRLLVEYGLVLFVAVIFCFEWLGMRAERCGDVRLAGVLVLIAIHGVVDPQLVDLHYNTFLLLIGGYPTMAVRGRVLSGGMNQSAATGPGRESCNGPGGVASMLEAKVRVEAIR